MPPANLLNTTKTFMKPIFYLIVFSLVLLVPSPAQAYTTDASREHSNELDECATLPTGNVPRFALSAVQAHHRVVASVDPLRAVDEYYEAINGIAENGVPVKAVIAAYEVITDFSVTPPMIETNVVSDENWPEWLKDFGISCGFYQATNLQYVVNKINAYLLGEDLDDDWHWEVSEKHDGSSFTVHVTQDCDEGAPVHVEWTISGQSDGAIVPTRNINYGRDAGRRCAGEDCAGCDDHGIPVWEVTEPYLNLWVHDTPVFYRTSLGKEIAFQLNYKQRDTRPRNDGVYPATAWSHNWYSYVHFDIPVILQSIDESDTNTSVIRISPRGVRVRHNWVLATNYTGWEAILYAPDNSESYYTYQTRKDLQNRRAIAPLSDTPLAGFRVVHADGSQDIYSLVYPVAPRCYGMGDRFGSVFDRPDQSVGPQGIWSRPMGLLFGSSSAHQDWQDQHDVASYSYGTVTNRTTYVQELGYRSADPNGVIEYMSFDALLTTRLDPYGNAIQLAYDSTNRLYNITDYDNQVTHFTYDTNGNLQTVTMPYGRAAWFSYSGTNLTSITDAQGMTSTVSYVGKDWGLNERLASLTTPYGTTWFDYQDWDPYLVVRRPSYVAITNTGGTVLTNLVIETNTVGVYLGEQDRNRAIIITHPNSSKEIFFYCSITNSSWVPTNLVASEAVINAAFQAGGTLDSGDPEGEGSLQRRNCFHWSRNQTPHLSIPVTNNMPLTNLTAQDFLIATWKHYPLEVIPQRITADLSLSPFPTFIRQGSPDGNHPGKLTWFIYPYMQGDNRWELKGEPVDWTEVTEAPDATPLVTKFSHETEFGLLNHIDQPYTSASGSIDTRAFSWNYQTLPVEGDDGQFWFLPALVGISNPFEYWEVPQSDRPTTTTVNGYPALSWPTVPVVDGVNQTSTYYYNSRHQLTSISYANGLNIQIDYDAYHFPRKLTAPDALVTNTFLFQDGELASQTTPLGLTLDFTHDLLGRLTSIRFPDNTTISNLYDRLDLAASKDRLGHWSYATYNEFGEPLTVINRNGWTNRFSYCNCGALERVTDPVGATNLYYRDYLGRVTQVVSAAGTVSVERDVLGQPFHIASSWGEDLRLAHNYQGLITGITNPAGTLGTTVFDDRDLPVSVTDARGVTETATFDGLMRLVSRSNGNGQIDYNTYSDKGLYQHYDGLGNHTQLGYDAAGRLTTVINANNETVELNYDIPHRRLSLTDGRSHTKGWAYDIYGRQVAETNAQGVLVRTNGYDANSRLTTQWTAAKGLATFGYDNNGNLLSIACPALSVSCTYDHLDRLSTMSDAVGSHAFSYTNFAAFDSALIGETGPLGTITRAYSGRNLASINLGSSTTAISRDNALRPHTITSPAGTFTYGFTSGASRRLTSLLMPGSTTSFAYDSIGQLRSVGVTNSLDGAVDYREYEHNANGWITTAKRLGGIVSAHHYDGIGQLTNAQALEPDGTTPRLNENLGYGYDASDNLAGRTADDLVETFGCNALNQITNITREGTLTVSGSFTGAVVAIGVNGQAAALYSDGTFATTAGLTLSNGNNVFVTAGSNAAGALVLSAVTAARLPEMVSLTYDLNGNLLTDGHRFFEYDDANRLLSVTLTNACRAVFVYDGLGRRRITREYSWQRGSWLKTNETRYVCDGYLPVQERDGGGNVRVTYTRGLDLSGTFGGAGGIGGLLARTDSSGSAFYHADAGGNITSLTDSGGGVVARYLYEPFGRLVGKWGPLADANAMQFSSMPAYRQAGLSLYAFRAYDPSLQRWLNQDPIGELGGLNLYGYVGNNPISRIDPLGLWEIQLGVGASASFFYMVSGAHVELNAGVLVNTDDLGDSKFFFNYQKALNVGLGAGLIAGGPQGLLGIAREPTKPGKSKCYALHAEGALAAPSFGETGFAGSLDVGADALTLTKDLDLKLKGTPTFGLAAYLAVGGSSTTTYASSSVRDTWNSISNGSNFSRYGDGVTSENRPVLYP
jgi:RHS repeat-associated protein